MLELRDVLWAGTEAALESAREIEARIQALTQQGALQAGMLGAEDAPSFHKADNVAIVPVRGPLVNIDSPILAFFGVASYPQIRRSMIAAAQDKSVNQILLDVDSGGGAVNGVADTADLIARINSQVKPVTAFADGTMASAAYWLGGSAGQVFASKTATVGSIGIIITHVDATGALAQQGLKVDVMRAGKYKALGHPAEPFTQEARDQIQAQLDAAYKVFGSHVAESRGVSYATFDEKMGQGRVFLGADAKAAGLIDGITNFDAMVSLLQSKKNVDKSGARI